MDITDPARRLGGVCTPGGGGRRGAEKERRLSDGLLPLAGSGALPGATAADGRIGQPRNPLGVRRLHAGTLSRQSGARAGVPENARSMRRSGDPAVVKTHRRLALSEVPSSDRRSARRHPAAGALRGVRAERSRVHLGQVLRHRRREAHRHAAALRVEPAPPRRDKYRRHRRPVVAFRDEPAAARSGKDPLRAAEQMFRRRAKIPVYVRR